MKKLILPFLLTLVAGLLIGCGGGDDTNALAPHDIDASHQNLSVGELKAIASDKSYNELIGHPGEGIFFDVRNPSIIENVEKHNGTLVYYVGQVEEFHGTEGATTSTVWICLASEAETEDVDASEYDCSRRIFLLYDETRGPVVSEGDVIEVAGIVVGGRKMTDRRSYANAGAGSIIYYSYHPTISVIKAKMYSK
jgi:hypothetical protein